MFSPSFEIVTSPEFCPSKSESTNSEQSMESSTSENTDSHFDLPPSDYMDDTQEGDSEVVVKVHTDWSCATRERLKLLRCASDLHQS